MENGVVKGSALTRAGQVRVALWDAMRRSRLSSRRRRNYDTGTFSRRRGARIWAAFYRTIFIVLFLIPSLLTLTYFSLIASPQYIAESKFTVQGGETFRGDALGMMSGMPSANVVQDTQVVADFIQSRGMVEKLQSKLDIRKLYCSDKFDRIARFDCDEPVEKLDKYWRSRVGVSIQLPGGIVTVTVKAFSAIDALLIADAVLELSENLVNDNNRRMLADNLASSTFEFKRAAERLGRARLALERARNTEGMLDPDQAGRSLADLITGLKGDRFKLLQDYNSQGKSVSPDAPQMRALNRRIRAISEQILDLEGRMTSSSAAAISDKPLSGSMTTFSELELDRKIAERQYAAAAASLEQARATAERRLVYLQTFVRPSLPEEPLYPKRTLSMVIGVVGSFFAWALVAGTAALARNNMA